MGRPLVSFTTNGRLNSIQLQNMHKVYWSAYVTIIAGSGDSPAFGLPGISSRARKAQITVDTHGHRFFCIPDTVQEIQASAWSTRGWTMQENLLSRRRLVFTESQTYFQCWNMHCCEGIPTCLTRAHTKDLKRFKDASHTFRAFPSNGIGRTGAEIESRIHEYLGRNLTNESDALSFPPSSSLPEVEAWTWDLPKVRLRQRHTMQAFSAADELRVLSFLSVVRQCR
jgi:hypothetical protein